MVNETSGEDLLKFGKKVLDEVFGPNENGTETLLPKVEDPGKEKGVQTLTIGPSPTTSEPKIEPEQKRVKINIPPPPEPPVKENGRETSSDSVTSIENKNSSISDDIKDILINSKEDTTETIISPGFMEMRLKRKSIMGSEEEEEDPDCTSQLQIETDNPSHLFWVPAHLHPEIAPNEFRKWLKNHAKEEVNSDIGSLRRRKSTLSRQYIPSEAEDDEEKPDKKVESAKFDWESYADENNLNPENENNLNPVSESTKLNILRRSLSLNLPPFMGGTISSPNDPNIFDRHSSPDVDSKVLVPRMSPALKRTARTRIRRNSVAGDENPRRFSAHRRTRSTHVPSGKVKKTGDDVVPKHKSESLSVPPQIVIDKIDGNLTDEIVDEPDEISKDIELDCIDVKDGDGPIRITLQDEKFEDETSEPLLPPMTDSHTSELQTDQKSSPGKSNLLKVNTSELAINASTTISPSTSPTSTSPTSTSPTSPLAIAPVSPTHTKRTSAWSWLWSGGSEEKLKDKEKDKDGDKDKEEKEPKTKKNKSDKSDKNDKNDKNENENNDSIVKEKSPKKSFSSIFSRQSKGKSTDDSSTTTSTTSLSLPITLNKKTKYTNYNRLPIHVERAIYRLSHVKLANPRRPLHEQVLISNMMFWYLSQQQVEFGGSVNSNAEIAVAQVKSKVGKEKTSRKRKKAEKKSGLTKKGAGPGSSAEIAYKAPQYDMNQISQQYITPKMPTSSTSYSNEFEEETVDDYGDNGEDDLHAHNYHHYNDDYLSDGTDGGYLDETNGRIESSHSGGLLHTSAEFDDNIGESSSGIKNTRKYVRSPSPNGPPSSTNGRSKSPTGRPPSPNGKSTPQTPQRNSVPPSNKHKLINIPRNRSSSAGTRPLNSYSKVSSKMSTVNSIADDEDDDVPLGLYKISSNKK